MTVCSDIPRAIFRGPPVIGGGTGGGCSDYGCTRFLRPETRPEDLRASRKDDPTAGEFESEPVRWTRDHTYISSRTAFHDNASRGTAAGRQEPSCSIYRYSRGSS